MGKQDRERLEHLRTGEQAMKESGEPAAVERYRDLAVMNSCKDASNSLASKVQTMGTD